MRIGRFEAVRVPRENLEHPVSQTNLELSSRPVRALLETGHLPEKLSQVSRLRGRERERLTVELQDKNQRPAGLALDKDRGLLVLAVHVPHQIPSRKSPASTCSMTATSPLTVT